MSKRLLMLLCLTMTAGSAAFAQYGMKVWRFGSAEQYILTDVDSVSFVKLVTDIQLTPTINMEVGNMKWLTAKVLPEDADNKEVIFFCSDPEVATVSEYNPAIVIGRHSGTCTVTCRALDGSGVFAQCQVTVDGSQGMIDGYDFVDLGLPSGTLWAKYNIGTYSSTDPGDFFAWGETSRKTNFSWETYKHCKGSATTITKYCPYGRFGYNGFTDDLTELLPEDDTATKRWSNAWQMPSREQFEELLNSDYTTTECTKVNDVNGLKVTSKSNGKSIFLPTTGYYDGTSLEYANYEGFYWSRSLGTSNSSIYGFSLYFNYAGSFEMCENYRYYGRPVRPVSVEKADPILVSSIELDETRLNLVRGQSIKIMATPLPVNARNRNVIWSSSDTSVATVNQTGNVTAVGGGACTITCTATDGSSVTATCEVRVLHAQPQYVDLGLPSTTLWATFNVGSAAPQGFGDYFAWGETLPKEDYSWSTYIYCNGTYDTMTKYYSGDGLTELEPDDDAATVNWGSDWQMPSEEQFEELCNEYYTTTEWTKSEYGIYGRKITSKMNGNSIFLPAAGWYNSGTSIEYENTQGYYSSRTLYSSNPYSMLLHNSDIGSYSGTQRCYGISVRPVRVKPVGQGLVESIKFAWSSETIERGETKELTVTVLPEDANNRAVTFESSDNNVATVSSNGTVTGVHVGSCNIFCRSMDGSGVYGMCQVRVIGTDIIDGHEYVDFGLPSGTLWATCNVGADSPEQVGNFYAWGETQPKASYDKSNYKYGDGRWLTKYITMSTFSRSGGTDGKHELEPNDDAATVNWGDGWQTPSLAQWEELYSYTSYANVWTTVNGVEGYLIRKSANSSISLFLPVTGERSGSELRNTNWGYFWTRTLWTSGSMADNNYSFHIGFIYSSRVFETGRDNDNIEGRWFGMPVRPVRKQ